MTTTVALLMGGWSPEREVSLSSGYECSKALENHGYRGRLIDVDREVSWAAFSPDGRRAISVTLDHAVRLWDLETGQRLHVFESTAKDSAAVAISPDGRLALSGGSDGILRLWRLPP